jgi:hypothetical protein
MVKSFIRSLPARCGGGGTRRASWSWPAVGSRGWSSGPQPSVLILFSPASRRYHCAHAVRAASRRLRRCSASRSQRQDGYRGMPIVSRRRLRRASCRRSTRGGAVGDPTGAVAAASMVPQYDNCVRHLLKLHCGNAARRGISAFGIPSYGGIRGKDDGDGVYSCGCPARRHGWPSDP